MSGVTKVAPAVLFATCWSAFLGGLEPVCHCAELALPSAPFDPARFALQTMVMRMTAECVYERERESGRERRRKITSG